MAYLVIVQDKMRPETPSLHSSRKSSSKRSSFYHHHQPFTVAHQQISLSVDLEGYTIQGSTELTIIPTDPNNRIIKLDARYMEISRVFVNTKRVNFLYGDKIQAENDRVLNVLELENPEDKVLNNYTIAQHQLYRQQYKYLFNGTNTGELVIFLPDKMRISLQDASTIESLTPIIRDSPGSYKTPNAGDVIYTPIQIKIEYLCKNPKDGVNFVGGYRNVSNIPRSKWHAYTTNSLIGISASSWVPCIDNMWEKSTWYLEICTARTVGDIGIHSNNYNNNNTNSIFEEKEIEEDDDKEIIVCASDLFHVKEWPLKSDPTKKITSFTVITPVSAHHLGWSIGAFEKITMDSLEGNDVNDIQEYEDEMNEEPQQEDIKGIIYCFKESKEFAKNACIILRKAIDFFAREFASFPFSSYSVVFVGDASHDSFAFAGLTIHNDKLLYGPDAIDPLFKSTEIIISGVAKQWAGINLVPKSYEDFWITIGMCLYMTCIFMKTLMGNNEFKFRMKMRSELVCEQDIGRRPIAEPFLQFPVNENDDFNFIRLKAPLVLYILNKRLTKMDRAAGINRIFSKVFWEVMSGDLPYGIDTPHFQYISEKVNHHNKLQSFFRQWIYGSGTPIFRITQRFNKKRMFVEMGIRQVQADEARTLKPTVDRFLEDACSYLSDGDRVTTINNAFTGSMTIRIHEADGTPYEHIVSLNDTFTKLDIQYNTKYRRLKRRQITSNYSGDLNVQSTNEEEVGGTIEQQAHQETLHETIISNIDASIANTASSNNNSNNNSSSNDDFLTRCLGNILQSEDDVRKWGLVDWTKEEEDKMMNEAFEWIRVDADLEWICKVYINQPDYMFLSQLQQDRDVEAQYESIKYFADSPNPKQVYSTILLRTLMDTRYYYGIRVEAAVALQKYAKEDLKNIGLMHLVRAFQVDFGFDTESFIPLPNDFSDIPQYFIQKTIPSVVAGIRDKNNCTPLVVKNFLLDLIRYNENGQNEFSDTYYVGSLIESLVSAIIDESGDQSFIDRTLLELDRILRLDEWIPSFQRHITVVILEQKIRLAKFRYINFDHYDLLPYTKPDVYDDIRIVAFGGILELGGLKNASFLRYFFKNLEYDNSMYLKHRLLLKFVNAVSAEALRGTQNGMNDDEFDPEDLDDYDESLLSKSRTPLVLEDTFAPIIMEDTNDQMKQRNVILSKETIEGSIKILRDDLSFGRGLQQELFNALKSPLYGIELKKIFYIICDILFECIGSIIVTLPIPRDKMITAKNLGDGKVVVFRQNRFKIQFNKKIAFKLLNKNTSETASKSSPNSPKVASKAPIKLTLDTTIEAALPKLKLKSAKTPTYSPTLVKVKSEARPQNSDTVATSLPPVRTEENVNSDFNVSLAGNPVNGLKTVIFLKSKRLPKTFAKKSLVNGKSKTVPKKLVNVAAKSSNALVLQFCFSSLKDKFKNVVKEVRKPSFISYINVSPGEIPCYVSISFVKRSITVSGKRRTHGSKAAKSSVQGTKSAKLKFKLKKS